MKIKAVDLYLRSIVPNDIDTEGVVLDKKGIGNLMAEVAHKHPEKYKDIVKEISDLGRNASYHQGETITLADMYPTFDKTPFLKEMKAEIKLSNASIKNKEDRKLARDKVYAKYSQLFEDMTMESIKGGSGHNLGNTVISGARGNKSQLKSMVTTPAVYTDYKDNMIDLFVENSYGEGLRPAEFLSSTFGTRKAVISTKEATADAGDLAKQMVQAATKLVISEEDCGTNNGISMSLDDAEELAGRFTQRAYGDVGAQSIIDKQTYKGIKKSGKKNILVRSPLTCVSKEGVCQHCSGLNFDGKLPQIGDSIGITAAQALGEPLTQGALNTKHGGGAFAGARVQASGFKVLNQIMQSPSTYPNRATLAEVDGHVQNIEDAPQGGTFVTIGDERHYVLPGFEVDVKKGDSIERGERISDGILNIKDVVRLRGLGSARKTYVDYLKEVFGNSGLYASTRNLELLSRGALDHVRVTGNEDVAGYLPDDLASYNSLVSRYVPPENASMRDVDQAVGQYLQSPALHYSIGTQITPNMASKMKEVGMNKIITSEDSPEFQPDMIRLRTAVQHEPDWMAGLHSSYQASRLQNAATSGADSNIKENIHFAPRLAVGSNFGDNISNTGKF
jgi:DNA-directed RNA polymerase subunit beta'